MDTSSSSLSLAGAEKEMPPMMGHAVMMDYYNSLLATLAGNYVYTLIVPL
jgi:hypothetical protein